MNAAARTIAAGAPFAEGHELSARLMASVPPTQVGRSPLEDVCFLNNKSNVNLS
jgi:hypothetical protein